MNLFDSSDVKYIFRQRDCDAKLKYYIEHNKCTEFIIDYLITSREHGRMQKETLLLAPFYKLPEIVSKINDDNKKIVDELEHILQNDVCKIRYSKIYALTGKKHP